MIPKYTINLLSSLSRWLDTRSTAIWARSFGHSTTMRHYSKSLDEIITYFKDRHPQCKRCGGTDGPLLRDLDFMDCDCVERHVTVDFASGSTQELTLTSRKTVISFKALEKNLLLSLMIRTGPRFESVVFEVLNSPPGPMRACATNVISLKSTKEGVFCTGAAYDFK